MRGEFSGGSEGNALLAATPHWEGSGVVQGTGGCSLLGAGMELFRSVEEKAVCIISIREPVAAQTGRRQCKMRLGNS